MPVHLLGPEPEGARAEPLRRRRRRRRTRWLIAGLALVVLAVTFGYLAGNEIQANTEFDQAHRSLDVTQGHIDAVQSQLTTVRRELAVVNNQVRASSTQLAQDTSQLQGVKKALVNAETNVTHQSSTIGDLHLCLGGVEQALNALAVGDQGPAIAALNAVSASCAKAVASNG